MKYFISPELKNFNKFTPRLRIGVLASGEGSNFQVLIDHYEQNTLDIEIKALITNNKNAKCIKRASQSKIPYFILNNNYSNKKDFEDKIIEILKRYDVELVVMAGWMRIASEYFVNTFKNKIINIHPSILPSFKGKSPVSDALKQKSFITGCSVHFVETEVDSGNIIIQAALPIDRNDNEITLTKKIHSLEHKILPYGVSEAGLIIRNKLRI